MQAISDKRSEEVSDASAYMWAGGRESFIGAVSGAIFGPFGTLKTLGGKMLLGGATNGFESMVRQTLDGQGINFKTTLFDVGIGAATAGVFHKAEKLFKKASPWVKKGASKVNDAIENANNKFKNMSDNFSSRFGNKLAFEGIGGFNGNSPINNVKLKPTRTQIAYNEAMKETKEAAEKQMKKATSRVGSNANALYKGIDRGNPDTYYSYTDLKRLIKESELSGRGKGLEAHHLLEKQFADVFGVNKGDIISVPLTPQWHRSVGSTMGNNLDNLINSELDNILTNSGSGSAGVEEIWQAHRNVYEKIGQSDWANAIYDAYVKKFNVPYK